MNSGNNQQYPQGRFINYQKNMRKHSNGNAKNQHVENDDFSEYFIYVGNLQTNGLKPNDLNSLIDGCLNQLSKINHHSVEINSITIYNNSIYISFKTESDAIEAAAYFQNFYFKSFKLESYYFDRCLSQNFNKNEWLNSKNEDTLDNSNHGDQDQKNKRFRASLSNIECELLVSNRQLKKYADSVNETLNKELFGINSYVKYLNKASDQLGDDSDEIINNDLLKDALNRNLLYLIHINQSNEQYNSIDLIIINKWRINLTKSGGKQINHTIKENKNMPLNKAIELLKLEYHDYIDYLKEANIIMTTTSKSSENSNDEIENEENNDNQNDESSYLNRKNKKLLNLVLTKFIECDKLAVNDLDFLQAYLAKNKRDLINSNFNVAKTEEELESSKNSNTSLNGDDKPRPLPLLQQSPQPLFPTNHSHIPPLISPQTPSLASTNAQPLMSASPAPSLMSLQTISSPVQSGYLFNSNSNVKFNNNYNNKKY